MSGNIYTSFISLQRVLCQSLLTPRSKLYVLGACPRGHQRHKDPVLASLIAKFDYQAPAFSKDLRACQKSPLLDVQLTWATPDFAPPHRCARLSRLLSSDFRVKTISLASLCFSRCRRALARTNRRVSIHQDWARQVICPSFLK